MRLLVLLSLAVMAEASVNSVMNSFAGTSKISMTECAKVCKAVGKGDKAWGYGSRWGSGVKTTRCKCVRGYKVTGWIKFQCTMKGTKMAKCCYPKCSASALKAAVPPSQRKCEGPAKGWTCPKNGGCDATNGACTYNDVLHTGTWKDWVAAHNVYRCMHDVPAVQWNEAVYQDAERHFKYQAKMEHSHCYQVKPPAGPAGENLYWSSNARSPFSAAMSWYSEFAECGPFPGCSYGSHGTTGHFTSMEWQGVKTIGCFMNTHKLAGCRYKAKDVASCSTPNFGGKSAYTGNIFARKHSFSSCVAKVKACGFDVKFPSGINQVTGFWESATAEETGQKSSSPPEMVIEDDDDDLDEEEGEEESDVEQLIDSESSSSINVPYILTGVAVMSTLTAGVLLFLKYRTTGERLDSVFE